MLVREERPQDVGAIRTLTEAAFRGKPYSAGTEAGIVDALRQDSAMTVSLVAELDGVVVGHIVCSAVHIDGARDWHGLGPVSVLPEHQGRGVGSQLVRAALAELDSLGSHGCVLLGSPAYYARFGFTAAAPLRYPHGPAAYFQALTFRGERPSGVVRYHPSFG